MSRAVTSAERPSVPSSPFGDDDGSADPRVLEALSAYELGKGGSADVLAALVAGRVLVPVVPMPDHEADGAALSAELGSPRADANEAHMATVMTTGRDGRRGLLAFTSLDTLRQWNPEARPSPVPTRSAAEAALADGADALVIDLAGPVVFSVDARDLRSLAAGWRPLEAWLGVEAVDSGTAESVSSRSALRTDAGRSEQVRRAARRAWQGIRRPRSR